MLNREACERRVFRLAYLLLGDAGRAMRVIEAVVDAKPDLGDLDSAHMDRLTVLRSREAGPKPAPLDHPGLPDRVAAALAGLGTQPREAWILSRVYRLPDREVARSMDCSVTATTRHRDQADAFMRERLGDGVHQAVDALLRVSMSLDVPAVYRTRRRLRRRLRVARIVLAVILGLAAIGAVVYVVLRGAG